MTAFIANIIVGSAVIAAVAFAIRRIIRNRKNGCGCGCSTCQAPCAKAKDSTQTSRET